MKTVKWVHSDSKQAGKTLETLTRVISHLGLPLEIKVTYISEEKLTNVLEIAESQMSTAVKYLKDDGADKLENTEPEHQMFYGLSYALSQIEKIKKEE